MNYQIPITYTVENKNGVYEYSDSFEINGTISLIRMKVIEEKENRSNAARYIVKQLLINGKDTDLEQYFSGTGFYCSVHDLPITEYLSSINDLTFELIENSKIQVELFLKIG